MLKRLKSSFIIINKTRKKPRQIPPFCRPPHIFLLLLFEGFFRFQAKIYCILVLLGGALSFIKAKGEDVSGLCDNNFFGKLSVPT